jgi:hypothetical protein
MKNAKSFRSLRSLRSLIASLVLGASLLATPAFAADKTYQVTGPVLEVNDTSITVQKGKEKWTLARNKDTKVTGEPKVGAKVTISYSMTAVTIEAKEDGKAAKADAKGAAAEPAKADAKAAAPAAAPAKK